MSYLVSDSEVSKSSHDSDYDLDILVDNAPQLSSNASLADYQTVRGVTPLIFLRSYSTLSPAYIHLGS